MILSTCFACLDGRHRRCEDHENCGCSICGKIGGVVQVDHFETIESLPEERPKGRTIRAHKTRILSDDPKLIAKREYAREYRRRKREGTLEKKYSYLTDEQKTAIIALYEERGYTAPMIAQELGVNSSTVNHHLLRTLGKRSKLDLARAKERREAYAQHVR